MKKLFMRPGRDPGREPGAYLALRHRPRSGDRFGRGGATNFQQDLAELRLHRHRGFEHGRVPTPWASSGSWRRRRAAPRSSTSTRGSPAPAPSPTCTCRSARAATSPSSAALINYVLDRRAVLPRVRRRRSRTPPTSSVRTSSTPRTWTGCSPATTPSTGRYDPISWQLEGVEYEAPAAGMRDHWEAEPATQVGPERRGQAARAPRRDGVGHRRRQPATPPTPTSSPKRDETLQHPRCVFQVLKRHYARYTPEVVARGVRHRAPRCSCRSPGGSRRTAAATGRRRGSTRWAGRSTASGAQYIRAAAILQTLLGNMGRPGGGIMALRGHASIQGSTDVPTLFNLLPGYMPMPHAHLHDSLRRASSTPTRRRPASGATRTPTWSACSRPGGATRRPPENDFAFDYMPRINGDHSTYRIVARHDRGEGLRVLPRRREPGGRARQRPDAALRPGQPRLARRPRPADDRVGHVLEGRAGDRDRGAAHRGHRHRGLLHAGAPPHVEKDGTFTQTQRLLQWRHKAVRPAGRRPQRPVVLLPPRPEIREKLAGLDRPARPARCWTSPGTTRRTADHEEPERRGGAAARSTATDADGRAAARPTCS